jgi:hypothetical protein
MSVVERERSAEEMLGRVCSGQCMSLKDSLDPRFWLQNFNVFKKLVTFTLAYEKHTSLEFFKHSTLPKLKSKFLISFFHVHYLHLTILVCVYFLV